MLFSFLSLLERLSDVFDGDIADIGSSGARKKLFREMYVFARVNSRNVDVNETL